MANKCDGIWRKNKNSQPPTKKRVSKPNLLMDFEMDPNTCTSEDTTTQHDQSAEGPKKVQRKKQGQQNLDVASRKKKQDKEDQNVDSVPPKKKSKEELQKEKKERQISRNAAMEAATKWIEEHATNKEVKDSHRTPQKLKYLSTTTYRLVVFKLITLIINWFHWIKQYLHFMRGLEELKFQSLKSGW
ncbi:uncharacterized protein LOC127720040 isoform X2 [Mytilus californianus]|uniref:uncharacterized protein LOC127700915 isoform X2 n=1 Tax=Mytilus californianus TaxID=6549 RepID=UPI002246A5F8|nr:uncharacterized protein LOC127700915 isoform X2 [Mytilus californianus]XP_052082408.1 uncharacterized protein LOC127720040 isoform X2 [Mytilus californianus]